MASNSKIPEKHHETVSLQSVLKRSSHHTEDLDEDVRNLASVSETDRLLSMLRTHEAEGSSHLKKDLMDSQQVLQFDDAHTSFS